MNKCKFLKKSLAMLLAVMLVVAMIPLGASAAWEADGTNSIILITDADGSTNVLEKTGANAGTLTLPYEGAAASQLTVRLQNEVTKLTYKVDDAEAKDAVIANHVATIPAADYKTDSKTITLTPYAGETAKTPCVITIVATAPRSEVSLKSAVLGTGDSAVTGTVNGTAITFDIPWGYNTAATDALKVFLTLNYPRIDTPTVSDTIVIGTDKRVEVKAQDGKNEFYTIITKMEDPLSTLKVAGVDAKFVEADDEASPAVPAHYEVVLPTGTKLVDDEGKAIKQAVVFSAKDAASAVKWNATEGVKTGNQVELTAVDGNGISKNTLTLTHKDSTKYPTPKEYKVWVSVAKNTVGVVESFKAFAENNKTVPDRVFEAAGNVSGKTMTVEFPFTADMTSVCFELTVSDGADYKVTDATGADVTAASKVDGAGIDMSEDKAYTVEVIPEDATKNSTFYTLTATKVDNRNTSTKVSSMKMTIGTGDKAEDYNATISGQTITFTVPYGTVAQDIEDADFAGAYPSGSKNTLNEENTSWSGYADVNTTNDLSSVITFVVTAENEDSDTYTIKFVKSAAKTGKTLSGVSFVNAATADDVKAENTYAATVSGKNLTATFPYSAQFAANIGKYNALVPQFTASEGAKLYKVTGGKLVEVESGFITDEEDENVGDPKNTLDLADFWSTSGEGSSKDTPLYVLDEAAVFEFDANGKDSVSALQGIGEDEKFYKAHVSEITVKPQFAAAQTGTAITGATDEDGNITSTVSGNKLSVSIPGSYADGRPFNMTINASSMAVVRANSNNGTVLDEETEYTVAKNGDKYDLKIGATTVNTLVVENEAGNSTRTFTIEVTVRDKEKGALVTSAKVNGVAASIASGKMTVTLPAATDLTKVTFEVEVSPMASKVITGDSDTDEKGNTTYDVSDLETTPLSVQVTSEDTLTTRNYTLVVNVKAINFTDVPEGQWYHEYVYAAANAGIVKGITETTYGPSRNITRRDFAIMVVRLLGVSDEELATYKTSPFSDVAKGNYAEKEIAYCADKGIIDGVGGGKFNPGGNVTREQAVTMLGRAMKLEGTASTTFADDAKISSWAKNYVNACVAKGIISGKPGNKFDPAGKLTRAEAAKIFAIAVNQK